MLYGVRCLLSLRLNLAALPHMAVEAHVGKAQTLYTQQAATEHSK
jgi:hypothetical protein